MKTKSSLTEQALSRSSSWSSTPTKIEHILDSMISLVIFECCLLSEVFIFDKVVEMAVI